MRQRILKKHSWSNFPLKSCFQQDKHRIRAVLRLPIAGMLCESPTSKTRGMYLTAENPVVTWKFKTGFYFSQTKHCQGLDDITTQSLQSDHCGKDSDTSILSSQSIWGKWGKGGGGLHAVYTLKALILRILYQTWIILKTLYLFLYW